MKNITTASGKNVPLVGLGTFPLQGREIADVVKTAVHIGYRLFDTADDYRGEPGIGLAVTELKNEGFNREDLFLQTKISENASYNDEPLAGIYFNKRSRFMQRHSVEELVREKVDTSLRLMKTEYIDSLLIHLPYPGYIDEIWNAMIQIQKEGKIRYIGVSNFHKRHIESVSMNGIIPSFNEIYISPIGSKQEQIDYSIGKGIQLMTYSPLMDLASKRIPLGVFEPLVQKYQKTIAQLILRWNIERKCLPLPKSKNLQRLKENIDIFDFSLTKEEVDLISSLNRNFQYLPESTICPGL